MKKQSKLSYKVVDFLRFPLIMVVVLIHCNYIEKSNINIQVSAPIFYHVIDLLGRYIYSIAVPLFFFISGYLFFREGILSFGLCKLKLKKRIRTLVIPYIAWNSIGLILFLLKISPLLINYFPQYADFKISISNLLQGYISLPYGEQYMPYDLALWFIRNLIIILSLAPLINLLFKYLRGFSILIPILLNCIHPNLLFGCPANLYYFMLGALFPVLHTDLSEFIRKVKWYTLIIWAVTIIVSYILNCYSFIVTTTGIFAVIYLGYLAVILGYHIPVSINRSTFFIYAFHALYISIATTFILNLIPPSNELRSFVSYSLIFVLLAGGSFIVFKVSYHYIPQFINLLCGGRIKT